ncbi:hypothetical protein LUZ61_013379 [Rhynchospora tenuis]|uniref:Late embryogenesis abundant protein LEA-2 subgroup domain-containing protein n=1 Tax=Rhynchospora tenuis TaxID=198213 RepID=A0AAD5YZY4_9POAL|nr:hypothetical protein LUZ61_013379 [Rhynchospora tenuis]
MDNHHQSQRLADPPPGPTNPVNPVPTYISLATQNFHRHHDHEYSHEVDNCQRLVCFSCTFLFFSILLFLVTFVSVFTIINPKVPKYTMSSIIINSLHVNPENAIVSAEFTLFIKANNPNKRIGILYRDAGKVTALFRGNTLCRGEIPQFLQPGNNISLIKIGMKGETEMGPDDRALLLEGIAGPPSSEGLELDVLAQVPVAIQLDNEVTIWNFRVDTFYTFMVNIIAPRQPVKIVRSQQFFEVDFMDWM